MKNWDIEKVSPTEAIEFNRTHHSRLPHCQKGPWKYAFVGKVDGVVVGSALWHNPSARGLPNDWAELRRMALSSDAPYNFASWMIAKMVKWLKENTSHTRVISYQDVSVHSGTIYKASNWIPTFVSRPRNRDREKPRAGTLRSYRSDANGSSAASSAKIRWEMALNGETIDPLSGEALEKARYMTATR